MRRQLITEFSVIVVNRQYAGEDRLNTVELGKLAHHGQIVSDSLIRKAEGNVISASENDHNFRLEIDNILLKAPEHLTGNLAVDSAIYVTGIIEVFL